MPTNGQFTCPAPGNIGYLSWTPPTGYTTFEAFLQQIGGGSPSTAFVTGSTTTFPTLAGGSYDASVETRQVDADGGLAISPLLDLGTIQCSYPSAYLNCNTTSCNGFTGTVNYTVTGTSISLQMVNVLDQNTGTNTLYTFTTSPSTFPTTPNHVYASSVTARIAGQWFSSNCQGFTCPSVSAPPGACPAQQICGQVTAAEGSGILLPGIVVELRDSLERLITSTKTISGTATSYSYNYIFPSQPDGTYFVDAAVGRTQFANPLQSQVSLSGTINPRADLKVGGVPATLAVSGSSGTLVLITTAPWTGYVPPAINLQASSPPNIYSNIIGANGTAVINVPGNFPYYITCWSHTVSGLSVSTVKTGGNTNLTSLTSAGTGVEGMLMPLNTASVSCPSSGTH